MNEKDHESNNKRWLHRLNLVTTLSEWVEANLSPTHIVWDGQGRDKKRSKYGRYMKASQYVYAHLMIGRMLYPCVSEDPCVEDPLFAEEEYPNDSMQLQLLPGAYPDFQAQVRQARKRVMNPSALALIPTVTWEMVLRRVKTHQIVVKLKAFATKSSMPTSVIIGLVLRYLCVGGLDDNLHASITPSGAAAMGSQCVECFASPFNHKFTIYFSIFEEDRVFGSQGNFFKAIKDCNGTLPPNFQRFEMNPPWINAVYERLVEIVDYALSTRPDLEIIVLAPQWVVTRWIPGFSSLLLEEKNSGYATHSLTPYTTVQPKTMQYIHDLSDTKLFFSTVSWVFTSSEVSDSLREYLSLPALPENPAVYS
jgi:hypothetical protein